MRGRANRTRLSIVGIIGLLVVVWFMLVRFNVASSWGWRQPKPDAPIIDVPKVWRTDYALSLIHISEPTRRHHVSRMPSSD